MTRSPDRRLARRGFTLVELLVALALVVLILTILAVAFGAASDTFSRMRSLGDMAERLRVANDKLRTDLQSEHFESGTPNQPDSPGVIHLSDLRYNLLTTRYSTAASPPNGGFFRIEQGSGSTYEGIDTDTLISTRATTHVLDFTVKRQGTSADDLFVVPAQTTAALRNLNPTDAPVGANQFVSKWARVRWFLANPQNKGGVTTYTLYRRVWAIAPGTVAGLSADEQELVANVGGNTRTLAELTNPINRPTATQYTGTYYGDDIVLTDVTSFEVKASWDAPSTGTPRAARANLPILNTAFNTVIPDGTPGVAPTPLNPNTTNTEHPFDDLPVVPAAENNTLPNRRVFDTWTSALPKWNSLGRVAPPAADAPDPNPNESIPLRIRVTALQVKIRVFEPKNQLSRQVTLIVPQ